MQATSSCNVELYVHNTAILNSRSVRGSTLWHSMQFAFTFISLVSGWNKWHSLITSVNIGRNIITYHEDGMTVKRFPHYCPLHYDDVIMTMLASQITSLTVVYSIVYSGVNQRKHQSSASLAFVREIHRGPVNFPHKWPVTRKMFPFDDVIMYAGNPPVVDRFPSTNQSCGDW